MYTLYQYLSFLIHTHHFDYFPIAPGFDVTAYSFAHVCPEREPEEAEGFATVSYTILVITILVKKHYDFEIFANFFQFTK